MEKYNKENKFYVYGIVVLLSIYVITITSSCIFKVLLYLFGKLDSNELTLPLAINNNSNAGVLYYCMLIYQTIGFYILLIIGIVCFSTYLVIVQHACCQFSILIWKIQGMFNSDREYVSRTLESKIKPLDEFNWIADIIVSYRKLTEYVDSINCFSQVTYLIAVFTAMFLIVVDLINLLQLSLIWQNVPKIIEFSVYITGSLFTIYINFYIGQKLLDFSEAVFMEFIYLFVINKKHILFVCRCQIPFYLLSRTTQYILIFLIRRSLKPCMLSIGGLFVSSHETFSGAIYVRRTIRMSSSGLAYFDQHFLLSNRLLQFLIRIHPNQSSNEQLFLLCTVTVCVSPMILHQMKLLYAHFKLDYELLADEDELNIMIKYTNRSKLYVYLIIVLINLYIISITFPSIINVFLYISGSWDDIHLTLPFPVNNVLNAGLAYYSLLIYQTLALFIVGVIGSICYSMYWVMIQHVCSQFSVIIWKMQQPFKNDQRRIENEWCSGAIQDEWNWMIDLIQCYTRMFQLSTVLQSASETITCCIYMAGSISTIYISLYVGQLVIDHSTDAFLDMCQIPFYTFSIKTQKLLLFLLTKSIRPSELSIGGIYVASHETFAGVSKPNIFFCPFILSNIVNI
ncbi:hypothetical protein M0802_011818 [Mischocyttarus mexicanus]|nr:hypothetical protein M0802_011818 [Mischocyttarus mexicanus]